MVGKEVPRLNGTAKLQQDFDILEKGWVKKLVVKNDSWTERRWIDRWMELRIANQMHEICYSVKEAERPINRIQVSRISEVKTVKDAILRPNRSLRRFSLTSPASRSSRTLTELVARQDLSEVRHSFLIVGKPDEFNAAREYLFSTTSEEEQERWVQKIQEAIQFSNPVLTPWKRCQRSMRAVYDSTRFQILVAALIFFNFVANVVQMQMRPEPESDDELAFEVINIALSVFFGLELIVNFISLKNTLNFFFDPWNWFDTVVVVTSLASLAPNNVPGLNQFRMTRILRNFKLLKSIKPLHKIIITLKACLPAVRDAFFLTVLLLCLYSVLGVIFFRDLDTVNFSSFFRAMFTLWQYITFDNACDISRGIMRAQGDGWAHLGTALFGISFQLSVSYILMNIVMAVLLDAFRAAADRLRLEEDLARKRALLEQSQRALDPLLAELRELDPVAVEQRVEEVFRLIDEDGSGSVDFLEMHNGLERLDADPPICLREIDFENLVLKRGLHDDQRMRLEHFKALIYSLRQEFELAKINEAVADDKLEEKLNAVVTSLKEVTSATRKIRGLEDQIGTLNGRLTDLQTALRPDRWTTSSPAADAAAAAGAINPPGVEESAEALGTPAGPMAVDGLGTIRRGRGPDGRVGMGNPSGLVSIGPLNSIRLGGAARESLAGGSNSSAAAAVGGGAGAGGDAAAPGSWWKRAAKAPMRAVRAAAAAARGSVSSSEAAGGKGKVGREVGVGGGLQVHAQGTVRKLAVKGGRWVDRWWIDRWMELRGPAAGGLAAAELVYADREGDRAINRIAAARIAEVLAIRDHLAAQRAAGPTVPTSPASRVPAPSSPASRVPSTAVTPRRMSIDNLSAAAAAAAGRRSPSILDMVPRRGRGELEEDAQGELEWAFVIRSRPDRFLRVREYVFAAESEAEMEVWVGKISEAVGASRPQEVAPIRQMQRRLRALYKSAGFEAGVACLILVNFVVNIVQAQVAVRDGSSSQAALDGFNMALSILFGAELAINMLSSESVVTFLADPWNWFDTLVVVVSLVSLGLSNVPGLNQLRMARIFRNFKLLRKVQSLNRLITSIREAVPAVRDTFVLTLLVLCLYSVLGVMFFRGHGDAFRTFAAAMFSMWQYITFDNAGDVTLSIIAAQRNSTAAGAAAHVGAALFGVSFQLAVSYILMNIVLAVLLDEFDSSSQRFLQEEEDTRRQAEADRSRKALDPLLAQLSALEPGEAEGEIEEVFRFIDEDGSGSIDFLEMHVGLERLDLVPPICLQEEDFDHLVLRRGLHEGERMRLEHFKALLTRMLHEYELVKISRAVADDKLEEKLNAAVQSLREVLSATAALRTLESRILDLNARFDRLDALRRLILSRRRTSAAPGPADDDPPTPPSPNPSPNAAGGRGLSDDEDPGGSLAAAGALHTAPQAPVRPFLVPPADDCVRAESPPASGPRSVGSGAAAAGRADKPSAESEAARGGISAIVSESTEGGDMK